MKASIKASIVKNSRQDVILILQAYVGQGCSGAQAGDCKRKQSVLCEKLLLNMNPNIGSSDIGDDG